MFNISGAVIPRFCLTGYVVWLDTPCLRRLSCHHHRLTVYRRSASQQSGGFSLLRDRCRLHRLNLGRMIAKQLGPLCRGKIHD
jgi:hypothetical protein